MAEIKGTNVWIIINEMELEVAVKYDKATNSMVPAIFSSEKQANEFARTRFHMWTCFNVNFESPFGNHKPNIKSNG